MPQNKTTIKKALEYAHKQKINHKKAEQLLLYSLQKEYTDNHYLYLNLNKKISDSSYKKFKQNITLLKKQYPLEYITNYKFIYGLKFYVNSHTLIPRFDTEILIHQTIKHIDKQKNNRILLADICTGTGCVLTSVALNINKNLSLFASDISKQALDVAVINFKKYKIKSKVIVKKGDMAEPLMSYLNKTKNSFDKIIITSNPPYLSDKDYKKYYKNFKFEPKISLYADDDGLFYYEKMFKQIEILYPKVKLDIFLEHNFNQKIKIRKLAEKYLPVKKIKTFKDLSCLDRVTYIEV